MMSRAAASTVLARRADAPRPRTAGRLRLVQHGVDLGHLGRRLAGDDAAGDVGAVPGAAVGEHRAAEVAQHDLAGLDHPGARLVVRAGGVLARRRRWRSSPAGGPRRGCAARARRSTSASVRPTSGIAPRLELGGDAVDGRAPPGGRASISAASFTARSGPMTSLTPSGTRCAGRARWRSSRNRAQVWSPMAAVARPRRASSATMATGSSVSSQAAMRNTSGRSTTRGASSRGHHQRGLAVAGQHQHGEPLEGHGLVAGQPGQVGADREQQHVDAVLGHAARTRAMRSAHHESMAPRPGRPSMLTAFFSALVRDELVGALAVAPRRRGSRARPRRLMNGTRVAARRRQRARPGRG